VPADRPRRGIAEHKPDVMCLQETKVQDHEFPVDEIRDAEYYELTNSARPSKGVVVTNSLASSKAYHVGPILLGLLTFFR
jgi:exonuclease III